MLVVVDDNAKIQVRGGQSTGIFIEYESGGHWRLEWTCDSSGTGTCGFDVTVSIATGAMTNVTSQFSYPTDTMTRFSQTIFANTVTTTGIDGITFDTQPGATITLSARLGGQAGPGAAPFFIQDGKVNGGYPHAVSDPLMLVPASP
jgi:hypothetical protein